MRQFCLNTLSYELALAGADCDLTEDWAICPFDLMLIEDVGVFMADASPFTLCKIGPDQSEPIYHLAQVLFARQLIESGPDGEGDYTILRDPEDKIERLEWLEHGLTNLYEWLDDEAIYDPVSELRGLANAALAAWTIYVRDHDYFVRDGQIVLLAYNGETSMGHRHPTAELYAALAAKEGLRVERATLELGAINADDYLARYAEVAGVLI
jgi:preprotein translocase subunit SecA